MPTEYECIICRKFSPVMGVCDQCVHKELERKHKKESLDKRQLIKEMARELYIQPEVSNLQHCVLYAKQFYDNIEAELDRALGSEE